MTEQIERIDATLASLKASLDDIGRLARAVKERDELRRLLEEILSYTVVGGDGNIYAIDGFGRRTLPSGMVDAMRKAIDYLE